MRKTFCTIMAILLTLMMLKPNDAHAQMDPKAKAFLTITAYGAAGGAILGAASTAFGTSARAIPQGASLGLYAGIFFATYVLVSHHNKRYGNYDDNSSPYQDSSDVYSEEYQDDEGGSNEESSSRGGFFDRFETLQEKFHGQAFSLGNKERGSKMPPLSMKIIQYNF